MPDNEQNQPVSVQLYATGGKLKVAANCSIVAGVLITLVGWVNREEEGMLTLAALGNYLVILGIILHGFSQAIRIRAALERGNEQRTIKTPPPLENSTNQ